MKKILIIILFFSILIPVFGFAQEEELCPVCEKPGGIVSCGRSCDDPSTIYKNECDPCTLCDIFEGVNRIIDIFVLKIAPAIAVLIIMIAGFLMMGSYAGKFGPDLINKSKKILWSVAIGLALIYLSWIIISSFLSFFGVMNWTGMDEWWIVNCPGVSVDQPIRPAVCGDNFIQTTNDEGVNEVCDGLDLGEENCKSQGFDRGILKCSADCLSFDASSCKRDPIYGAANFDLPFPPPLSPLPLSPDLDGSPDNCNKCSNNFLGVCEEQNCYKLGDCNWSPVREIEPILFFNSGGMCFFNNDCSACGSAFIHECIYGECGAIGFDCVYVANFIGDKGGICVLPSKNECSKCSQIPGGCKEELCKKISPNCVFAPSPTEQNPGAGICSVK